MPIQHAAAAHMPSSTDALRQQLISDNLALVHHVARQLARGLGGDVEVDELVSAGTLGLMAAVDGFDAGRGLAFSTFATPRIRGAMLDELRRHAAAPRSVRRKARSIAAARQRLADTAGRPATGAEIAREMGIDLQTLWQWEREVEQGVQVSINHADSDDRDATPHTEILIGDEGTQVEDRLTLEGEVEHMKEALLTLNETERVVLTLNYYEELRLREIAEILDLTESRVSQIRTRALTKLRALMAPLRACR